MQTILFGSIVRNGVGYLPRYFEQLNSLRTQYNIKLAITEGDSTDHTYELLKDLIAQYDIPTLLYKFNHAGNLYGSVNVPERWRNIARTWNYMLDRISLTHDFFCYMECDLKWHFHTIDKLINGMYYFNAVAPMSMLGNLFYDTWGHRAFGHNFVNNYPYHPDFEKYPQYMPITSAGSCIMMQSKVAKVCRLSEEDAMIGHDIIKKHFTFMLDKSAFVYHP